MTERDPRKDLHQAAREALPYYITETLRLRNMIQYALAALEEVDKG